MILAFDSYYFENSAKTVCVAINEWTSAEPSKIYTAVMEGIEEYVPGQFFKRELPCILSLFNQVDKTDIEAIVVDGYVYLDDEMQPGLGGHLYNALSQTIPVIGVAKSDFKTLTKLKYELYRGESVKPLYITSIGIDMEVAFNNIKAMHGSFRIPTVLKTLDTLTKVVNEQ